MNGGSEESGVAARSMPWRLARAWLPPALYMAIIWWSSSRSMAWAGTVVSTLGDKVVHMAEYAVLAFLLLQALMLTFIRPHRSGLFWTAVGATVLWGTIDELHQSFVPSREADAYDVLADFIGAVTGATLYRIWERTREKLVAS